MKKFLTALLAMSFIFAGCGKEEVAEEPQEEMEEVVEEDEDEEEIDSIRVATLKGPTAMGLMKVMDDNDKGEAANTYDFSISGAADEIISDVASGKIDIATVPANVASVLYNKTEGAIQVMGINTWGVLHILDTQGEVKSIEDLEGKTIYSVGQGTTPEYALKYVLEKAGVNCDIEFKSEATELAALLESGEASLAMLPEPFVSSVLMQNEEAEIALSLVEEWDKVEEFSLVTGTVIVNKEFAEANKDKINAFLEEYKESADFVNENVEEAAKLMVQYEIVPKEPIAEMAIPRSSITFVTGEEMKENISGYLETLFSVNEESIGGALPEDDFYYMP